MKEVDSLIPKDVLIKSRNRQLAAKAAYENAVKEKELARQKFEVIDKTRGVLATDLKKESDRISELADTIKTRKKSKNFSSARYQEKQKKEAESRLQELTASINCLDDYELACENFKIAKKEMHEAYQEALELKKIIDSQKM